jgi:tetratricopeptide (TPR) repeat protein
MHIQFQVIKKIALLLALLLACSLSGCAHLTAASHLHKSSELIIKGDYNASIGELNKAIEAKPDYHLGYINRALAYQNLHEYDKALADYRRAIDLQPNEALTHANYVEFLIYMRKTPEAMEHARSFLNTHPDSLLIKLAMAQVLETQEQYQNAYQLTSSVIPKLENLANYNELTYVVKDNFLAHAYMTHALAAAGSGKTDEASRSIQKAASYWDHLETNYHKAKIYYIQNNWQSAVNELNAGYARATQQEKDSPSGIESKFLLANSYFKLGNMAQARSAYEDFLAVNKYEPEAFFNLGQAYAKLGDEQKAIDSYSSTIRLNKYVEESSINRGSLYLKEEKYNDAIADFSEALAKQSNNTSVLYKRAYSYCLSSNHSMGKKDLKTILKIEPDNSQARTLLTQCQGT